MNTKRRCVMDIYITGKVENKNGHDVLMSAVAIDGELFKLEAPFTGEQTYCDVIVKVMKKTEDYLKNYAGSIEQTRTRNLHFHTDYLGSYHEAYNQSYRDEKINAGRNSLAELLHTSPSNIQVDNLDIGKAKKTLMQRVFGDEADKTYHFKSGDLVICGGEEATSFSIYARVITADRKSNQLMLDRYQEYGEFSVSNHSQDLLEMELAGFYRPMTDEEILRFHKGMTKLLADPEKSHKIDDLETAMMTYKAVGKAVENIRSAEKSNIVER